MSIPMSSEILKFTFGIIGDKVYLKGGIGTILEEAGMMDNARYVVFDGEDEPLARLILNG